MSPEIIAALVAGITTVAGAIAWGIKLFFNKLTGYLLELKPNGGASLKDQVNRLEESYKRLESSHEKLDKKVDKLYELLISLVGKG